MLRRRNFPKCSYEETIRRMGYVIGTYLGTCNRRRNILIPGMGSYARHQSRVPRLWRQHNQLQSRNGNLIVVVDCWWLFPNEKIIWKPMKKSQLRLVGSYNKRTKRTAIRLVSQEKYLRCFSLMVFDQTSTETHLQSPESLTSFSGLPITRMLSLKIHGRILWVMLSSGSKIIQKKIPNKSRFTINIYV